MMLWVVLFYVDDVAKKVAADADAKVYVVDDDDKEDVMTDLCCPDAGKVPSVSKVLFVDVHHLCDELPRLDVTRGSPWVFNPIFCSVMTTRLLMMVILM